MRTNLKVFRVKTGLTQEEFAKTVGCSRGLYSAVENGSRQGRRYFWNMLQKKYNIPDEEMWKLMQEDTAG